MVLLDADGDEVSILHSVEHDGVRFLRSNAESNVGEIPLNFAIPSECQALLSFERGMNKACN